MRSWYVNSRCHGGQRLITAPVTFCVDEWQTSISLTKEVRPSLLLSVAGSLSISCC